MPSRNLATAILRNSASGQSAIDTENGVLRGVKLMELGKVAHFASEDGKHKSVTITASHIDALLSHAGNRAIPVHETHEWFDSQDKPNADSVEMNARIGALKAFRRDGNGDLIADAYFKEGQKRNDILWGAANNPEDNCFSVVFSYDKSDPQCIPKNFRAADLVPAGAATTALFSEANPNQSMDINELITLLDDPKCKDAIKAIVKSHQDTADESDAATMEADAGVSDADKKDEDKQKPAMMRAAIRIARMTKRVLGELKTEKTALLAAAKLEGEAGATALLGKSKLTANNGVDDDNKNEVETVLAPYIATGCSRGTAILRFAKDHGDKYNTLRKAGKI